MTHTDKLKAIFGDPSFVPFLVDALDAQIRHHRGRPCDELRERHFTDAMSRVTGDVSSHPRRALLCRFLENQSQLSDKEITELFGFVYSFIVNQFKGEVAEILAWPILDQLLSTLIALKQVPPDSEIVGGADVRGLRPQTGGWQKNVDALLLANRDSVGRGTSIQTCATPFMFVGAVEIKSYRLNIGRALAQIDNNVDRLAFGARVRDLNVPAGEALVLATARDGRASCARLRGAHRRPSFPRLVIRPQRETAPPLGLHRLQPLGSDWAAELPITTEELSWAAYRLTDWFIGEIGSMLFTQTANNPWPEMTGADAGRNAFRAAMYEAGRRDSLMDPAIGSRQAVQTFRWLYNAMCYGHERATGKRVLFPEHVREREARAGVTTRTADDVLGIIHRAYARGHLEIAGRLLASQARRDSDLPQKRKYAWLMAMIAYRQCRFADALRHFPGPAAGARDNWWTRDLIMLARLRARNGDGAGAREYLQELEPLDQWRYGALPLEHSAVLGLAWLADSRANEAAAQISCSLDLLESLRHRQETGDLHNVHVGTVVMAVLDLAASLVALGRENDAVTHITRLSGVDKWEVEYVREDPMLAGIRPALQREWGAWR